MYKNEKKLVLFFVIFTKITQNSRFPDTFRQKKTSTELPADALYFSRNIKENVKFFLSFSFLSLLSLDSLCKERNDLIQISNKTIVSYVEDRCSLVLIDGDDHI